MYCENFLTELQSQRISTHEIDYLSRNVKSYALD